MKKILKIIAIVLLLIVVLLLFNTIRKTVIISKLQNKVAEYMASNNYYIKTSSNMENNATMIVSYYQKNEKQTMIMEKKNMDGETKISMYNNGERIDTFTKTKDSKTVKLNSANTMSAGIKSSNVLETDNLWQTFICSIMANVKSIEVNGKSCYEISNFLSPNFLAGEKTTIYEIEKETGLVVKSIVDNTVSVMEYEFNNVEDSIFVEPDVSEYTLQENN